MRNYRAYTDEQLINGAKQTRSIAGLLKLVGLRPAGGNYAQIKKHLQRLKVSCAHWTGQGWSKDQQLKDWQNYGKPDRIRPHLIRTRGQRCENCKRVSWLNKPIPLEVHHIDGDRTNNLLINLQLVCPNCHSGTSNYRGRKNRK